MSAAPCPTCGVDDRNRLFCPAGHLTVSKVKAFPMISGKMDKFWATGDPSVFAAPGAFDYDPRNANL